MTEDDIQAAANAYQSIMLLGEGLAQCSDKAASCVIPKISNIKTLENAGYRNAYISDRVLKSDLVIGVVEDGKIVTK